MLKIIIFALIILLVIRIVKSPGTSKQKYWNMKKSSTQHINAESSNVYDDNEWKNVIVKKKKYPFDSTLEKDTYNMLRHEVGSFTRIDFHVHLNEIFEVSGRKESYFNKMWVCHVDFIVRDRKDLMNILFAVEVDGAEAHQTDSRVIINDSFKNKIFEENNIPLIRVSGKENSNFKPFQMNTYPTNLNYIFNSIKMQASNNIN